MRFQKPEGTGVVSVNMTPMIDMVFNLLIFFILTAQFVQLEIEEVALPVSTTAKEMDYTQYKNVVINIKDPDDPKIIVMGRTLTPQELTEILKERKEGVAPNETMNVILRADAMVTYDQVAIVMLAAGRAQIPGWWITTELDESVRIKK